MLFPDLFLGIDVADLRKEIRQALRRIESWDAVVGADYSRIVAPRIRVVCGQKIDLIRKVAVCRRARDRKIER